MTSTDLYVSDIAEAALLGAALIDHEAAAELSRSMSAEAFDREAHQVVADAIIRMHRRGDPTDSTSVLVELMDNDQIDVIGGPAALSRLTSHVVSASWRYYADLVVREWRRRTMHRQLVAAVDRLDAGDDPLDVAERIVREVST